MAGILACGFETADLTTDGMVVDVWEGDLDAVVDAAAPVVADGGTVVCIHPGDDSARWAVDAARAALDTVRLVAYGTDLPPLAGAELAAFAGRLAAAGVPAANLLAVLPEIETAIKPMAWLGSVTQLQRPAPSVVQHARSLLPRGAFLALHGDEPHVRTLTKRDAGLPLPAEGSWRITVAVAEGDPTYVDAALAAQQTAYPVTRVRPRRRSDAWWGTPDHVELAVVPEDEAAFVFSAWRRRLRPCAWCDGSFEGTACPLCGMRHDAVPMAEVVT